MRLCSNAYTHYELLHFGSRLQLQLLDVVTRRKKTPTHLLAEELLPISDFIAKIRLLRKHSVPVRRADSADQAVPKHQSSPEERKHMRASLLFLAIGFTLFQLSMSGGNPPLLDLERNKQSEGRTQSCSVRTSIARQRCAASCGGSTYRFSPGFCGVGASCACIPGPGTSTPAPLPKEP